LNLSNLGWLIGDTWILRCVTSFSGETTISATDDIGHDHIGHTEHHIGHKACRLENQWGQRAAASKESGFVLSSQEAV